jgi:hypothetical protein
MVARVNDEVWQDQVDRQAYKPYSYFYADFRTSSLPNAGSPSNYVAKF